MFNVYMVKFDILLYAMSNLIGYCHSKTQNLSVWTNYPNFGYMANNYALSKEKSTNFKLDSNFK